MSATQPFDQSWCARINARAAAEPVAATGSPYQLRQIPSSHTCECCGTTMYDHHCKIVCPNCGYKRDCSDP